MLNALAFITLGFLILIAATSCVTSHNVVHAAFWLLLCAAAAAGMVWYLGAEYIAITQLFVYAGAVSILTIFAVMVTHRSYDDASREVKLSWSALILSGGFFALVAYGILNSSELSGLSKAIEAYDLKTFGELMFMPEGHVLTFELASMVLLVALVAAVWWTQPEDTQDCISASLELSESDMDALPQIQEQQRYDEQDEERADA